MIQALALKPDAVVADIGAGTGYFAARLANMLPASLKDVEQRVKEGFSAILGQGPQADEMIKIGRGAAGR